MMGERNDIAQHIAPVYSASVSKCAINGTHSSPWGFDKRPPRKPLLYAASYMTQRGFLRTSVAQIAAACALQNSPFITTIRQGRHLFDVMILMTAVCEITKALGRTKISAAETVLIWLRLMNLYIGRSRPPKGPSQRTRQPACSTKKAHHRPSAPTARYRGSFGFAIAV